MCQGPLSDGLLWQGTDAGVGALRPKVRSVLQGGRLGQDNMDYFLLGHPALQLVGCRGRPVTRSYGHALARPVFKPLTATARQYKLY